MSFRTQDTSSHLFFLTSLQREASVAPSRGLCQGRESAVLGPLLSLRAAKSSLRFFPQHGCSRFFEAVWTGLSDFSLGTCPSLLNLLRLDPLTGLRLCGRGFIGLASHGQLGHSDHVGCSSCIGPSHWLLDTPCMASIFRSIGCGQGSRTPVSPHRGPSAAAYITGGMWLRLPVIPADFAPVQSPTVLFATLSGTVSTGQLCYK